MSERSGELECQRQKTRARELGGGAKTKSDPEICIKVH